MAEFCRQYGTVRNAGYPYTARRQGSGHDLDSLIFVVFFCRRFHFARNAPLMEGEENQPLIASYIFYAAWIRHL